MIEIKYTRWGIASRIGNTILINEKLKKYPQLHTAVLQHELDHSSDYQWHDILIDIQNHHLQNLKKQYYSFIVKNPKSWVEFLPFGFYDGRIAFNATLTLFYGLTLIILGGLLWILI